MAPTTRVPLTQISSRSWEHPADKAALQALRALPGFDEILRRVMGALGERGIRQLFLANSVKVSPTQRPKLNALYAEVLETLDAPERYDLYVSQTPVANAFAIGFQRPFIVINSGMLELLDDDERRSVLAHEVGHIMSGHNVYTTLAMLFIFIGSANLPFFAGIVLLPFELAILEWYRKAEFSADRAALLGTQDPDGTMRVFLKLAGGAELDDPIDLQAFLAQANEYEYDTGPYDKMWQVLNTIFRSHPFATVRAAELQRWIRGGDYDRILRGEYARRSDASEPIQEDVEDAVEYYGARARRAADTVNDAARRAKDAFSSAFSKRDGTT